MMFTCTTRFEIEEKQLAFIRSLSIYEEGETDELSTQTEDIEPISDTEEDEDVSIRAGKRRKSVLSDNSDQTDNDDDLVPLPMMPESQIRVSGRMRKRPRVHEGYELG
jgi:hypothetical protein